MKLKYFVIIFNIIFFNLATGSEKTNQEGKGIITIFNYDDVKAPLILTFMQPIHKKCCCSKTKNINGLEIWVTVSLPPYSHSIPPYNIDFKCDYSLPLKYFMVGNDFKKDGDIIEIDNEEYVLNDKFSSLEKWYRSYNKSYSCVIL